MGQDLIIIYDVVFNHIPAGVVEIAVCASTVGYGILHILTLLVGLTIGSFSCRNGIFSLNGGHFHHFKLSL